MLIFVLKYYDNHMDRKERKYCYFQYPGAEKTIVLTRLYAIDNGYTGFRKCFLMFLGKLNFLLIILILENVFNRI